jgi:hypothetical protein
VRRTCAYGAQCQRVATCTPTSPCRDDDGAVVLRHIRIRTVDVRPTDARHASSPRSTTLLGIAWNKCRTRACQRRQRRQQPGHAAVRHQAAERGRAAFSPHARKPIARLAIGAGSDLAVMTRAISKPCLGMASLRATTYCKPLRWASAAAGAGAPVTAAQLYRLRLITADPLSLRNRTVCDLPCKTTLITPEIPYSLL